MLLTRKQFGKEFAQRLYDLCCEIEDTRDKSKTLKIIIGGGVIVFPGKKRRKKN